MDVLAHALWTNAAFRKAPWKWQAILIGFLIDAVPFGPVVITFLVTGFREQAFRTGFLGAWTGLYNVTHSLVVIALVVLIVFAIRKEFWWVSLAWGLHVGIDIFTHARQFFPTPYLWPFPSPYLGLLSWGTPWFLATTYAALAITYLVLYRNALAGWSRRQFAKQ
jgi:hypothetical protein